MMAPGDRPGFIVLTAMALHLVLHRILLVRLVGLLGKTKQMWLPPSCSNASSTGSPVFQGAVLLSPRRRSGCPKRPSLALISAGPALDPAVPAAGPVPPRSTCLLLEPPYPAWRDPRGIFRG